MCLYFYEKKADCKKNVSLVLVWFGFLFGLGWFFIWFGLVLVLVCSVGVIHDVNSWRHSIVLPQSWHSDSGASLASLASLASSSSLVSASLACCDLVGM
jgi:hypothetical protein